MERSKTYVLGHTLYQLNFFQSVWSYAIQKYSARSIGTYRALMRDWSVPSRLRSRSQKFSLQYFVSSGIACLSPEALTWRLGPAALLDCILHRSADSDRQNMLINIMQTELSSRQGLVSASSKTVCLNKHPYGRFKKRTENVVRRHALILSPSAAWPFSLQVMIIRCIHDHKK